jgi:hypothetical protein
MLAAHTGIDGTAVDALVGAMSVDVLAGRGLETPVPIRR